MLGNFQVKAMLATANPEAARHFYGEVLGLSLVEEHPFAILYDSAGIRVSPMSRGGSSGRKRASRVAGTRCGSYGEALATCTARGRP